MTVQENMNPGVALIVGGGPGISASCARLFRNNGMRVAVAARNPEKSVLIDLAAQHGVRNYACDAADADAVKRLFDAVDADLGSPTLVVHNIDGRMRDIFRKRITEADPTLVQDVMMNSSYSASSSASRPPRACSPALRTPPATDIAARSFSPTPAPR